MLKGHFIMFVQISGWVIFSIGAIFSVPSLIAMLSRTFIKKTGQCPLLENVPLVSIIIAARDEEVKIEETLQSCLSLNYSNYELIVVNDRSTDKTGDMIDQFANKNDRLKALHVTELPDGWLGKVHAMHLASKAATGEFLLFMDGDILLHPETVTMAMQYVVAKELDHLCLFPGTLPGSHIAEEALVASFGMLFAIGTQPLLVPTSFKKSYVGIGAFNLVRRTAYNSMGGHEPLKLNILDDVKLGMLIKRYGFKQDVLLADKHVKLKWQDSAWGVICGLEKNGFASMNYSFLKMIRFSLYVVIIMMLPSFVAPFVWNIDGAGFIAAAILGHLQFAIIGQRLGRGLYLFPLYLFALAGILFAFWRSAFITTRQQGVRWRDTFYSLRDLRNGLMQ